ncbi:N-acyl homoserine lactonase family protein [Methylobacterium nonmethylotrophicum]|uniref:N-acyl homoserine lactonase family protein n=1 Tax=Methylobacterium nonmethylotrophicum TaxID=1141884 RepID=A0A4Z0NSD3_9HYPH|nr:N-acyl homoserine lactonase family protein [Methylobacterium nonmethylotrophicum]TGD99428.1 N-acyl homoserine lactonase family protein [Methylobacterium nonmethylotrophicum]
MDAPAYEIIALRYATHDRPASANLLYAPETGDPHDAPMPIDYFVWVIRDATRVIVVDTGFDRPACEAYGRTMVRHPVEGLRLIGIDPAAVRDVIITHLHYDHAGNLAAFPDATFHLQDSEMAYATGRCMCHARLRGAFSVEDVCTMVRRVYEGRVAFVDGTAAIAPGVTVHAVPGHTRGLQCVRVETARGPVVLASDAAHFYANLAQQNPFPIVVDVAAMMESWRTLARLAGDPERIVPGHDPLVMARYPRHPAAEVEAVLLHLPPHGPAA